MLRGFYFIARLSAATCSFAITGETILVKLIINPASPG